MRIQGSSPASTSDQRVTSSAHALRCRALHTCGVGCVNQPPEAAHRCRMAQHAGRPRVEGLICISAATASSPMTLAQGPGYRRDLHGVPLDANNQEWAAFCAECVARAQKDCVCAQSMTKPWPDKTRTVAGLLAGCETGA